MEKTTSNKKARTRSMAVPAADGEVCAAAGANLFLAGALTVASEPLEVGPAILAFSSAPATPTGPASSRDFVDRLPAALTQHIFLLLHAHDRMRCRAVSRAWRAALADRACWRNLRFSGCEDLLEIRASLGGVRRFILAAGRAAGGAAEEIDFRGVACDHLDVNLVLKRAAEANGGSLRVLRVSGTRVVFDAAEGLDCELPITSWLESRKLPHLEELEADVRAQSVGEARRLLEDARQPDGRFKALQIRMLGIAAEGLFIGGEDDTPEKQREVAESLAEFLRTAVPAHPSLAGLVLYRMPLLHPGLMDAVADAAVARGLESLHLFGPQISHACLPALSRALRSGCLRSLALVHYSFSGSRGARRLDGPPRTHAELCAALRGSRLESLQLRGMRLWADPDSGRALLAALTAHPTLRSLDVSDDRAEGAASKTAAAEALAALLDANAPALKSLSINSCGLVSEHLERILGLLRGNTHLAALDCAQRLRRASGRMKHQAWATRVVLPLVQANTTLRALKWDSNVCGPVGEEVDTIMRARAHSGLPLRW